MKENFEIILKAFETIEIFNENNIFIGEIQNNEENEKIIHIKQRDNLLKFTYYNDNITLVLFGNYYKIS